MSWASDKAREIHSQEMCRISIDAMIERGISEAIKECARKCDDTDDNYVGRSIRARILDLLEDAP